MANFDSIRTLVVKLGTTLLTREGRFDGLVLEAIVKDLARLKHERGLNLLIVSSGAMGCGMDRLAMKARPTGLPVKQATAAVGQSRLMAIYEALFQTYGDGLHTAQVLLSAHDLDDRATYLNVRNTINALFDFGNVVPIVNENDSTATEELRFGDNDTLAAKVAAKIDADLLIILSNVDGLYTGNPDKNPHATLVDYVENVTDEIANYADDTQSVTSIGGMHTKLQAARIACSSGLPMILANGHHENAVTSVLSGSVPHTHFGPALDAIPHRKRWIAFGRSARGHLRIDDGARDALLTKGRSLLAAGIVAVDGDFEAGEAVDIQDRSGRSVARGLTNYARSDIDRIKGLKSADIAAALGRKDFDEVVHRDNLVLL